MSPFKIYTRLLRYIRPFRVPFYIALVGNILYGVVDALLIKLLQPLLDQGFGARDATFITWIPAIILGIFLLRGVANFCATHFMGWVSRNVVMTIRQEMFSHLLKLPASYFDAHPSGEILSRITYDVEQVANASTEAIEVVVREIFTTLGLLAVMLSISWQLTCLFLITVPLMTTVMRFASKRLRDINRKVQASMGGVTQIAQEAIDGHKEVKIYGGEVFEKERFVAQTEYNRRHEMKVITTSSISVPIVQLIGALALAATIYLATLAPLHNGDHVTAGAFAAMVTAMMALLKPIKQLTKINSTIQRGIAAASSIFAFLDGAPELHEIKQPVIIAESQKGTFGFNNVSMRYGQEGAGVLHNVDLTVAAGEMIALVGRSGSGKTSLVHALLRLYPCEGNLTLHGIDASAWTLTEWRKQFALVSQHVTLFNDTIYNNIAYARRDATPAEVEEAARLAHAFEYIQNLPQGFDTPIGENGLKLSGGQRQRLAIARAILKQAPILILDEATSALDSESERYIQQALATLMQRSTTLVIAHRLSTIEHADRIVVMDKGHIVEVGSHEALLKERNLYHKLWQTQAQALVDASYAL